MSYTDLGEKKIDDTFGRLKMSRGRKSGKGEDCMTSYKGSSAQVRPKRQYCSLHTIDIHTMSRPVMFTKPGMEFVGHIQVE